MQFPAFNVLVYKCIFVMIFRVGSLPTPGKCAYNYLCCLETYALKTLNNIAGAYLSF